MMEIWFPLLAAAWHVGNLAAFARELELTIDGNVAAMLNNSLAVRWTTKANSQEAERIFLKFDNLTLCSFTIGQNGTRAGVAQLPCNCLPFLGDYSLETSRRTTLLQFRTSSPNLLAEMAAVHQALSGPIKMAVETQSNTDLCKFQRFAGQFSIRVLRLNDSYQSDRNETPSGNYVDHFRVDDVSRSFLSGGPIQFDCGIFYRAGRYKFQLWTSLGSRQFLAADLDGVLTVVAPRRGAYALRTRNDSIFFHCGSAGWKVSVERTAGCRLAAKFGSERVRLYAVGGSIAEALLSGRPTRTHYVAEIRLPPAPDADVLFPCGLFSVKMVAGHCFDLVSVFESDGAVQRLLDQPLCLPTRSDLKNVPKLSRWSEWKSWTDWQGGNQKHSSRLRLRSRKCEPTTGRAICIGEVTQSQFWTSPCKENSSSRRETEHRRPCSCGGCRTELGHGGLVIVAQRHCATMSSWTVGLAQRSRPIRLSFLGWSMKADDFLEIRCGNRVAFDAGFDVVVGTRRRLLLQCPSRSEFLLVLFKSAPSRDDHSCWPADTPPAVFYIGSTFNGIRGPAESLIRLLRVLILVLLICAPLAVFAAATLLFYRQTLRKIEQQQRLLASSSSWSEQSDSLGLRPLKSLVAAETRDTADSPAKQPLIRARHTADRMQTSTRTESTRLSEMSTTAGGTIEWRRTTDLKNTVPTVSKRSIGIQLTCHSPLFNQPLKLDSRMSVDSPIMTRTSTKSRNGSNRFESQLSLAGTEQDFEYDYYEAALPCSFLQPATNFESEIDIDQIIGKSYLMASKADGEEVDAKTLTNEDKFTQFYSPEDTSVAKAAATTDLKNLYKI